MISADSGAPAAAVDDGLYRGERFGTAVSCMDGRCLDAVNFVLKSRFGVHHIDTITEPGLVGQLAAGDDHTLATVQRCLEISVNVHHSRFVAVFGHYDCTGNPVDRTTQATQIEQSCRTIQSWGFPVQIIGLYVNELWQAELVCTL